MKIEFRLARAPKWITKSMKIESRPARAPNWSVSISGSSEDHKAVFRLQRLSASYASYASYASCEWYNASLHVCSSSCISFRCSNTSLYPLLSLLLVYSSSNSQAQRLPKLARIILKLILMWCFCQWQAPGRAPKWSVSNKAFFRKAFTDSCL